MSEMVERVARAMYGRRLAGFKVPHGTVLTFDEMPDWGKEAERQAARAAIAAMREPTETMLLARPDAGFGGPSVHDARTTYRAMIDAALAEEGK